MHEIINLSNSQVSFVGNDICFNSSLKKLNFTNNKKGFKNRTVLTQKNNTDTETLV